MKKQATTSAQSTTKRTRQSNTQPQLVGAIAQQVVAEAKQKAEEPKPAQPRPKKIVDISVDATAMQTATDKAQLIIARDEKGEWLRFWLPKSQINIIPNADEPGKMIFRVAGWLYYRAKLNEVFPAVQWSTVAN